MENQVISVFAFLELSFWFIDIDFPESVLPLK